jgi:hypothetical protein
MPRLNRVLEELGIHHEEYDIPANVLTMIEENKKKAVAKNATAVAKAKKRKGARASRAIAKKLKVSTVVETSVASTAPSTSDSAWVSASAENVSSGSSGRALTPLVVETKKLAALEDIGGGQGAEVVDQPEPSAANPMPCVLGGDSSSSEGVEDAGRGGVPPTGDAEARVRVNAGPWLSRWRTCRRTRLTHNLRLCFKAPPSGHKRSV